jgi:protein O-mannosyl-transferase
MATNNSDNNTQRNKKLVWILLIGIVLITCIVYYPMHKGNFLNWDDNVYVTENHDIQGTNMEHIKKVFTKSYVSTYLPLTMLSYSLDYKIGTLNPEVYKYTNLILHIFNSLLVFWFVLLLMNQFKNKTEYYDQKKSYIIATITSLLFALHPINVESVVWIAERKNVLFVFFFLLSLIAYFEYINLNNYWLYILSLLLFLCSLLSKGAAVSLTLTIVLLDYFLKRTLLSRKVILEKIPFLILSLVFGYIAFKFQGHENIVLKHPFYEQVAFASYGLIQYLSKLVVPVNLSGFYSYPVDTYIHWVDFGLVIILIYALFKYWKHLNQLVTFGILFFVLNLIFLIQIIPVGKTIMADRYIYLPSIGCFFIVAILISRIKFRISYLNLIIVIIFFIYGFSTYERVKVWNNSLIFWNDVIKKDNSIPVAWHNRGTIKHDNGDIEGALNDINKALQLKPDYDLAYYNRGNIYREKNDLKSAAADYTHAIEINPNYISAYTNRGNARLGMGEYQAAIFDYNKAIYLSPDLKEAVNGRGIANVFLGKYQEALSDFSKAIKLDPKYSDAYYNRGKLLKILKRYPEALADLNMAIQTDPENLKIFLLRAKVYLKLKSFDDAIRDCNKIIDKNANNTNATITRAAAYYQKGSYNEAMIDLETVIRGNPNIGAVYYLKGMTNIKLGNKFKSESDLVHAKKLGFVSSESDYEVDNK